MRQLRILLQNHKIVESLLSPVNYNMCSVLLYQALKRNELKGRINSEWAAVHHALNVLSASGVSAYALAFVLEADIFRTC